MARKSVITAVVSPRARPTDTVIVGSGSYVIPREYDNAAAIENEPYTYFGCAPNVVLGPSFVAPSAIDAGDVIELDGSASASTLLVPNAGYQWSFGDGTTASGPSVVHSYSAGGNYNVTLKVTDRGGNAATLVQQVEVSGPSRLRRNGRVGLRSRAASSVRLQLQPQSLKTILRSGIAVRVTSNAAANGIATVVITRKAAKRAHIKVGRGPTVRIGLGTVSSIKNGSVLLHLHLSAATAAKLRHLGHVDMTIRLALVAPGNKRIAVDAAASY